MRELVDLGPGTQLFFYIGHGLDPLDHRISPGQSPSFRITLQEGIIPDLRVTLLLERNLMPFEVFYRGALVPSGSLSYGNERWFPRENSYSRDPPPFACHANVRAHFCIGHFRADFGYPPRHTKTLERLISQPGTCFRITL